MRIFAAFAIAPMTAPLLALVLSILFDDVVYYEFILGLGAIMGYGFAIIFGIPAYFLFFRELEPVRIRPFVWFVLSCLLGYVNFFGVINLAQDGVAALLSPTFLAYGLIFFVCTSISVFSFYLIGFHGFGGKHGAEGKALEK